MAEFSRTVRIAACVALDMLDFTIGRAPGFGVGFDIGLALIAAAMWGKRGWWHLWEVFDVTEQFCGFVPTCTLIALSAARAEREGVHRASRTAATTLSLPSP